MFCCHRRNLLSQVLADLFLLLSPIAALCPFLLLSYSPRSKKHMTSVIIQWESQEAQKLVSSMQQTVRYKQREKRDPRLPRCLTFTLPRFIASLIPHFYSAVRHGSAA
jgi:hypothetical protein